jgi:hypothetical protein
MASEWLPQTPARRWSSESCIRQATTSQIIHATYRTQASAMVIDSVCEKPSEPTTHPCTRWVKPENPYEPRLAVTMPIDLDNPLNDPHSASDVAPFEAHADASIHRGCARRDGRRAGRL